MEVCIRTQFVNGNRRVVLSELTRPLRLFHATADLRDNFILVVTNGQSHGRYLTNTEGILLPVRSSWMAETADLHLEGKAIELANFRGYIVVARVFFVVHHLECYIFKVGSRRHGIDFKAAAALQQTRFCHLSICQPVASSNFGSNCCS